MPQSSDPYTFTIAGLEIPGIGEAKDPTSQTVDGSPALTLNGHPQFGATASWDSVMMPQPKTREKRAAAAGSTGPDSHAPDSNTLNDLYRYWPAHRDVKGGVGFGDSIKTEINVGPGCDRYESASADDSVSRKSSDEGYWDPVDGTNLEYAYRDGWLTSPNYRAVYAGDDNQLIDIVDFDADYIIAFNIVFARSYFTNCCTRSTVSCGTLDGPDEWGDYSQDNQISYGAHYYDDYNWCSTNCCAEDPGNAGAPEGLWPVASYPPAKDSVRYQTCGSIFREDRLGTDYYEGRGNTYHTAGQSATQYADGDAGRMWLDSSKGDTHWRESDSYGLAEPAQTANNPPGPFGVVDDTRAKRQLATIQCWGWGGHNGVGLGPNGGLDFSEGCLSGCAAIKDTENYWFLTEGKTYPNSDL